MDAKQKLERVKNVLEELYADANEKQYRMWRNRKTPNWNGETWSYWVAKASAYWTALNIFLNLE